MTSPNETDATPLEEPKSGSEKPVREKPSAEDKPQKKEKSLVKTFLLSALYSAVIAYAVFGIIKLRNAVDSLSESAERAAEKISELERDLTAPIEFDEELASDDDAEYTDEAATEPNGAQGEESRGENE